ncbi:hypothetical protein GCM10022222_53210 [Amycolatopsis ultiminotia]|uniref:Formyl transferase N-terminal domain-containing protein n=1 Tax=Amycolatopsis ultiminotia TaxID=543629 RepID=A0ABP6X8W6_9PSEU
MHTTFRTRRNRGPLDLVDGYEADPVVLARYMQILSGTTGKALHARTIDIHHSFLPGATGPSPITRRSHGVSNWSVRPCTT